MKSILTTLLFVLTIHTTFSQDTARFYDHPEYGYRYWCSEMSGSHTTVGDTVTIEHTGESYFETQPEKYIGIHSIEGYSFHFFIKPEKAARKLYISNFKEDNTAILSVIQGKAEVQYKNELRTVPEGYTMIINDTSCTVYKNKCVKNDTSWITGLWKFTDRPFSYVVNKIARNYSYETKCKDTDGYTFPCDNRFNGSLTGEINLKEKNIRNALNALLHIIRFRYKIVDDTVIIY